MVLKRHDDSWKLPKPRAASTRQNNSMRRGRRNTRDGVTASVTERQRNRGSLTLNSKAETAEVNARDGNGFKGDAMMPPQKSALATRRHGTRSQATAGQRHWLFIRAPQRLNSPALRGFIAKRPVE
jgi:hypothetical protein